MGTDLPSDRLASSPLVYAHRGASAELPENTLDAFRLALELGADVIETDAHVTRDGRVVLCHDPTPSRVAGLRGAKAIAEASLAEVRTWDAGGGRQMPTLDEALDAFPDAAFNVDMKEREPRAVSRIVECVRSRSAERRVRLASFHQENLRRARAMGYAGRLGMGRSDILAALFAPRLVAERITRGADAAQVPPRAAGIDFTHPRTIDRLHARGFRVDIWVIDDPEEARALVARGIDGIVTNDPRRVVPAVHAARAVPRAVVP